MDTASWKDKMELDCGTQTLETTWEIITHRLPICKNNIWDIMWTRSYRRRPYQKGGAAEEDKWTDHRRFRKETLINTGDVAPPWGVLPPRLLCTLPNDHQGCHDVSPLPRAHRNHYHHHLVLLVLSQLWTRSRGSCLLSNWTNNI